MRFNCGLSSCLLLRLLLRFILQLLLLSGRGSLAGMETEQIESTLTVDSLEYFLFAEDLAVNYTLADAISSDDVEVRLINHDDGNQLASFPLPSNSSEGQLIVSCGAITSAGRIVFAVTVKDSNLIVTVSEIVHARWPPVTVQTSTGRHSFAALTENIAIEVIVNDWERLLCPGNDSSTEYSVSLDYYGSSDWRSSPDSVTPRSSQTMSITNLFDHREHSLTFHCRMIDQAGDYLVVLRSPKSLTVAVSQFLEVRWNSESYQLRSPKAAIFPCSDDVIVNFQRPRCAANDDKIRLYRQLRQENVTLASSSILSYVAERRARKSSNHVAFACSEFEEELAPSYCWKYVSTAHSGATYEHKTLCLPATTMDRPRNGDWSTWSEWSACSATCLSGTQVRFRSCDNPPPANGGAFCAGPMTDSRQCDVICPELSLPTTALNFLSTNSSCDCGCRLTEPEGTVVAVPSCPSVAQWVIALKEGLTIRLTFLIFNLESGGNANIRVRDGESAMSNLLLNSYDAGTPPDIVSTGSVLMIEFRTPVNYSGGGFVAKYSAQARNMSVTNGSPQSEYTSEAPVWKSAVIIVGVALGVIAITIAVVVVCCDVGANRRKRRKKRLNTKGHTVAFDTVPKTRELDYDEVTSSVRVEVPGGLEIARVYPSAAGSDDITPSKFLATSSPYLDASRERHSLGKKRTKTRTATSERNPTPATLVLLPVDQHPVESLPHSSKTGTHQRRSRKDEGGARYKRRSKSRDRKPPPPSSTFEEDLLMLARQNEVTGGGIGVTLDPGLVPVAGLGPWGTEVFQDAPRVRSSSSSRPRTNHDAPENIPLQSVDAKGRTRKHRTHHSSSQPRANQGHGVTGRGHGVVVGKRPPVEGSYNTEPDSSYRTSADVTVEQSEKGQGRTLKDGATFNDGSGVVMTAIVDSNPQITDSDKLKRKLDYSLKNATPNYGPDEGSKNASSYRKSNSNATRKSPDPGLIIQSFLRSDPGPDGQSQRGTFRSNSNSLNCSNSPSFHASTERTVTHNSFRPCPAANHHPQNPKGTSCPAKSYSSPRNTPQMSLTREPVHPTFPPTDTPLSGESQPLNQRDRYSAEEAIEKSETQDDGTISAPS